MKCEHPDVKLIYGSNAVSVDKWRYLCRICGQELRLFANDNIVKMRRKR